MAQDLRHVDRKIYGVNFKFENDFAVNAISPFPHSLRETWVSAKLGSGQLTLGQFKPYRGLEEITSSNEITLMERPSTSSTGIYSGRQFLTGIGYRSMIRDNLGLGIDVMSLSHFGLPFKGITYGGREGISQSLGLAGSGFGAPHSNSQSTFSAEAAYSIRSLTLQGEYALSKLDNTHQAGGSLKNSTIQAFYVQASWFITGENAVYRKDRGAFGKPLPSGKWGALEIAGRYDLAENSNQNLTADPCRTGSSKCQVQVITLGVNWYPYQGIRFMLNYYLTGAMIGHIGAGTPAQKDNLSVLSVRTQISF